MKYFKITFKKDLIVESQEVKDVDEAWYTQYVEAESKDAAIEGFKQDEQEGGTLVENLVFQEISIDEYIEQEEKQLLRNMYDSYLQRHYYVNNMPIRKYVVFRKEKEGDRETYLKAIEEANRVRNLLRLSQRLFDLKKISVADLQAFLCKALDSISVDAFEQIVEEMPHKTE